MTQPRDPDAIVAAWLEDGPVRLPRETRSAIEVALRTQPRVRRMAVLGGTVTPMTRFATAAGIVLAVGLISVILLANRGGGPASPQASAARPSAVAPSSPPAASPSAGTVGVSDLISTAGWKSFTSNRYGYDIQYPGNLSAAQSVRQWTESEAKDWLSPANDLFRGSVAVTVFAVPLPAGTSRDAWIASHLQPLTGTTPGCTHTVVDLPTKEVDGHPVVFWRESTNGDCGGTFAFVQVGERLYTFFIGLPGYEPTLETMLSTLKFKA